MLRGVKHDKYAIELKTKANKLSTNWLVIHTTAKLPYDHKTQYTKNFVLQRLLTHNCIVDEPQLLARGAHRVRVTCQNKYCFKTNLKWRLSKKVIAK